MAYVDTNVVVAYGFKNDPNHQNARKIIDKLRSQNLISSPITLVELYSVLSRRHDQYKPPPELKKLKADRLIYGLARYLCSLMNLKILPDTPKLDRLDELSIYHIYSRAIKLAPELSLKTLDLFHLAYATKFHEDGLVDVFATLDREILEKKDIIEMRLGIKIIGP